MVLCEVCLEEFTSSSDIESLLCGHIFHEQCLTDWFEKGSRNCPVCRRTFEEREVHRHKLFVCFEEDKQKTTNQGTSARKENKEIQRLKEENESLGSLCQSLEDSIEEHKEEIASLKRLCKSLEETIRDNNEIIKALQ